MSPAYPTIIDALTARVQEAPQALAFRYLAEGEAQGPFVEWTYAELEQHTQRILQALRPLCAPGDRVLLLYPPGIEFVAAFYACLRGGLIAVPAYPPDLRQPQRSFQRLSAMISDAEVRVVLADTLVATMLQFVAEQVPQVAELTIIATDDLPLPQGAAITEASIQPETIAYLQYTSGSTGRPRGVVIRHRNIVANIESSRHMKAGPGSRSVAWVPLYHDLGLVSFVLSPVYLGFESTLFSPVDFLRRPARWVEAVSHFKATHTAGPTFGYDLVARKTPKELAASLDLSRLMVAGIGAEPVRAETLRRFSRAFAPAGFSVEALQPTYGLAETVLYSAFKQDLSAPPRVLRVSAAALAEGRAEEAKEADPNARELTSCGPLAPGFLARIVHPETLRPCPEGVVGELWLSGPSVADGYWREAPDSAASYGARLSEEPGLSFLRTGDLVFLSQGELFIVGRHKDLIIVGGRNLYPQDIERTAEEAHPSIRPGCVAAFPLETEEGEAIGVVAEVRREATPEEQEAALEAIRRSVSQVYEVTPAKIALISAETIPKTSSGKIRRSTSRKQMEEGELALLASWTRPKETQPIEALLEVELGASPTALELERFLCAWLSRELKQREIDPKRPLAEYGLDSVVAVALAREIETRTGQKLPPNVAWSYPTVEGLARYVTEKTREALLPELQPAPPQERYPLSFTELGLFRVLQRQPVQHAYNLFFPLALTGELSVSALEAGLQALLARHDALRTAFALYEGKPSRRVVAHVEWRLTTLDLSSLSPNAQETEILKARDRVRHHTFTLEKPPLWYIELLTLSPRESLLLFNINHMAVDAWSAGILLRDLGLFYEAFLRQEAPTLPPLPLRCSDYAVYAEKRFQEAFTKGPEAFPPYPKDGYRLPLDRPMPEAPSLVGARYPFLLPGALCNELERLTQVSGVPLSAALLCAFRVMLHRHARSPRVSFTVVRANRQLPGLEELVGYLVYGETVHSVLEKSDYQTLLRQDRETIQIEPQEQQPYNVIMQPPSMRVLFNYYSRPMPNTLGRLGLQLRVDLDPFAYLWDVHDLMLRVFPGKGMIICELIYRSEILDASTIHWMAQEITQILQEITQSPEQTVLWDLTRPARD